MTTRTLLPAILTALLVAVGGVRAAEPTFHGRTLAQWQAQLDKGTSAERGRAVMALGLGPFGKKAVPMLLAAMEDGDRHVRSCAIIALGDRGPDAAAAVPVLSKMLAATRDREHEDLLHSLGQIGAAAVPALIQDLYAHPDKLLHRNEALTTVGGAAVPALAKALDDTAIEVRVAAATALVDFSREDLGPAVAALVRAMKAKETRISWPAEQTLIKAGPVARDALPALEEMLKEKDTHNAAIHVLCHLGKPALPVLRKLVETGPVETRMAVLESLGWGSAETLALALRCLDDRDVNVRRKAANALTRTSHDIGEAIPRLERALGDSDEKVRAEIVRAVGRLETLDAVCLRMVARCLADESSDVREAAQGAVRASCVNLERAAPFFLPLLRDRRWEVRRGTIELFRGSEAACLPVVRALCESLHDAEATVRLTAARTLGSIAPEARKVRMGFDDARVEFVVPALRARLHDQDERVRVAAAGALCAAGDVSPGVVRRLADALVIDPEVCEDCEWLVFAGPAAEAAVPQLIKALDGDRSTRQAAARALGAIGPRAAAAVPALSRRLEDRDSELSVAVGALLRMGDQAVEPLKEAFERGSRGRKAMICANLQGNTPAARALVPVLTGALVVNPSEVRIAVLGALRRIGARGKDVLLMAKVLLHDAYADVRCLACGVLGSMGPAAESALSGLRLLLLDPSPHVRCAAVHALVDIDRGCKTILPALAETLADPDRNVRIATLQALAESGPHAKSFLPRLRQILRDGEPWAAHGVIDAIETIGGKGASVDTLTAVVRQEKGIRRADALRSLWWLTRERTHLAALVKLLEDEEDGTRSTAARHLDSIGPPAREFLPAIEALKKHPSPGVRATAHRLARALPLDKRESHIRLGAVGGWTTHVR